MKKILAVWLLGAMILFGNFIGVAGIISESVSSLVDPVQIAWTRVDGGNIANDTTWTLLGSPYYIEGNVTVDNGYTLTIGAGVEVKFNGTYYFYVEGTLNVQGNESSRVLFTSNASSPSAGDWSMIQINSTGQLNMDFCNVNYGSGVFFNSSSNNTISNCNISLNKEYGIRLYHSSNNNIIGSTISDNDYAIHSADSSNNTITRSDILNNWLGIHLYNSSNNNITKCKVFNNHDGITLISLSNNNIITECSVAENEEYGIYIEYSSNHIHHNNIINNTNQAHDSSSNCWDDEMGEGNYWDNYTGVDSNGDGIGDTPYNIPGGGNKDYYPLMNPYGFSNFTINLHHGWNLISIPLQLDNTARSSVLESIEGKYDTIQYYDASDNMDYWKVWSSGKPGYMNDLNSIDNIMGLWVHVNVTGPVTLSVSGYEPFTTTNIQLSKGWNMVGYPSLGNRTIMEEFSDAPNDYRVQNYSAEATYHLRDMNNSEHMHTGQGYWVYMPMYWTWSVEW